MDSRRLGEQRGRDRRAAAFWLGFGLQMGNQPPGATLPARCAAVAALFHCCSATKGGIAVEPPSSGSLGADMTRDDLVDPQPYRPFQDTKQATLLFSRGSHAGQRPPQTPTDAGRSSPGVSSTKICLTANCAGTILASLCGERFWQGCLSVTKAAANHQFDAATDIEVRTGGFVARILSADSRQCRIVSVFGPRT